MNEQKFLGSLLPSSPDFVPIIEAIRGKYKLQEVSPEGEVIEEIYLEDRIVPLEEFHQNIKDYLREHLDFLPEKTIAQYKATKLLSNYETPKELDVLPEEHKKAVEAMLELTRKIAVPTFQSLENLIDQVANMLYEYLLNGEAGEVPLEWSRKVTTFSNNGETTVLVMANQLADPEEVVKQFRHEYRKAFGIGRPAITRTVASTGYYLQLQNLGTSWKRIVEEFIRLEDVYMPRNTSSQAYKDAYRICEQTLRKRMQRSRRILEVIVEDKK